jgi:hypothetical protein
MSDDHDHTIATGLTGGKARGRATQAAGVS